MAVAEAIARKVGTAWDGEYGVDIEHLHIDRPVVPASSCRRPGCAVADGQKGRPGER
ncbi:hypothetical protein ABZ135_23005 [Streptomyces sp. NPDC006339]|uniref:hypothetical protein n=1 Tax=Streptomyces sp. NPDC006339 TaxID=3156755 RepID=UPI0033BE6954